MGKHLNGSETVKETFEGYRWGHLTWASVGGMGLPTKQASGLVTVEHLAFFRSEGSSDTVSSSVGARLPIGEEKRREKLGS